MKSIKPPIVARIDLRQRLAAAHPILNSAMRLLRLHLSARAS